MKKGHFLWSAHRITEKQKAGKARNIKGKRQSKNFSTVSRQHVVRLSSARDNQLAGDIKMVQKPRKIKTFRGFSMPQRADMV